MIKDGVLALEGYHLQKLYDKEDSTFLLMYKFNDFTFHIPIENEPKGVKFLGNINNKISATVTRGEIGVNYSEAIDLLERYIK